MLDSQGVFFNAQRQIKGIEARSVLSILTSVGTTERIEVESFGDLIEIFTASNIVFQPIFEKTSANDIMLHNPKSKIWPVRDQGKSRGTCVSFAALAGLELREMKRLQGLPEKDRPAYVDYSEEFIYTRSRIELGSLGPVGEFGTHTSGATFLLQAAKAMIDFGVPMEKSLPYRYIQGVPDWVAVVPQNVSDEASGKKLDGKSVVVTLDNPPAKVEGQLTRPFPKGDVVRTIISFLSTGSAVAITLPVYPTANHSPWTVGNAWKTGVIPDPTAAVKEAGSDKIGHAICIIGMVPDPTAEEGEEKGWFIFRNSWGTRFGYTRPRNPALDAVLAPGYGAISYAHVGVECWGIMALLSSG